ncbi:N-alpha-acetyltransferase, non-catalitic subunit [Coemansia sp. BCRC 34301]|nr:N-alpha-acetyltransferase, non-catalitic subunit [Coemansia sp. BCRC 34301]
MADGPDDNKLAALMAAHQIIDDAWLDITALVHLGAGTLGSGELIKQPSLSLFDAMTSVEVMDARLDMGMLTAQDEAEIAQWDMDRALTLSDTLWIVERLFCCEMTWHHSASLLQTIYMCNYYTADALPTTIGQPGTPNGERDLLLYPLLIATAACCRFVWNEYARENVYAEEDVHLGAPIARFFDEYALPDVTQLLDAANAFLSKQSGDEASFLLDHVTMRRRWLAVLSALAVERLADDPSAVRLGTRELSALAEEHQKHVTRVSERRLELGAVAGVFDAKCMRRFPSLAPIKPKELLGLDASHVTFARLVSDLGLVARVVRSDSSVEELSHVFLALGRRSDVLPFVRSLVVSAFAAGDGCVQLSQPLDVFVRRAISEISGDLAAGDRVDVFCCEASRMLVDWFRTQCQNAPRQRRIALKYLGGWDALQGDAEQLDIWLYTQQHPSEEECASDPAHNPFAFSSWAYHMKLLLLGGALLAGIRLSVYQGYEFPLVFCYAAQVYEAHAQHLSRMMQMIPKSSDQVERWQTLATAQKDLATAAWLISHAGERLGIAEFRAPWMRRGTPLMLQVRREQEAVSAERARFALRFRAFSRLNSPTPLAFDAWVEARRQVDAYALGDLFVHAQRVLSDAKTAMDRKRPRFAGHDDTLFRALYYAVVANSVALAKLLAGDAIKSPLLSVTGEDAALFRDAILADAIGCAKPKGRKKRNRLVLQRAHEWHSGIAGLASDGTLNVSWTTCVDRHPDWPVFSF